MNNILFKVLMLKGDAGEPTDEQTMAAVSEWLAESGNILVVPWMDTNGAGAISEWLDDHPEATTTVQDGAITKAKLHSDLLGDVVNGFYTPEKTGKTDLADIIAEVPAGKTLFLDGSVAYELSATLDLQDIKIYGNGATVNIKRADAGFTFNNTHKHAIRVFDNVSIHDVNFAFKYTASAEQNPVTSAINQRGLTVLGSNVLIQNCTFEYTQANTILIYGENVHNVRVSDCVLKNCANGIQCETQADSTGADYAVTFENCYVHAFASACGIGCATFTGCTFEHRDGSTYPNFQAGINDAEVAIGAVTSCINCRFIGSGNNVNVIVYGFNTVAEHTHRALASFVGCSFSGGRTYSINIAGNANFEGCSFYKSITPITVTGTDPAMVHITIVNSVFLGVEGLSGTCYLVSNTTATPCMITMIGCHVNEYDGNNLRLLNIPASAGEVTWIVMLNNSTGTCGVSDLKTPALWFNNKKYDGTSAHNISESDMQKYRWVSDWGVNTAFNPTLAADEDFCNKAYGTYLFSDGKVRFIGVGRAVVVGDINAT